MRRLAMRRLAPLCLSALGLLCGCAAHAPVTPPAAAARPQADRAVALSADQPAASAAATSAAATSGAAVVEQSARTLRELRAATRDRILDEAILSARAIIVLPGVYQAGFVYSVQGGNGVLIARRDDGGWGSPLFVSVAGAGYGWQAGLEKSRLVLAIFEEQTLARILDGRFTLDAFAMYNGLGVREQTDTGTLTAEQPVMAFADGVGLMAGVAVRGGALIMNQGMTQAYHGASAKAEQTMRGISAPGLEVFELWSALGVTPETPVAGSIIRAQRTR